MPKQNKDVDLLEAVLQGQITRVSELQALPDDRIRKAWIIVRHTHPRLSTDAVGTALGTLVKNPSLRRDASKWGHMVLFSDFVRSPRQEDAIELEFGFAPAEEAWALRTLHRLEQADDTVGGLDSGELRDLLSKFETLRR